MSGPSTEVGTVSLTGDLTIDRAATLREELSAALKNAGAVIVDMNRVKSIDLSFIQLLYGASAEASRSRISFSLIGTLTPEVRSMLEIGGFCRHAPADAAELESVLFDYRTGPARKAK